MEDNIKFKEGIQKLKESTSTKKYFKKTNPNLKICLLSLPKRLQSPVNYIYASVEKDTFYHKNIRPNIWSNNSITPYDIMLFCGSKFLSKTTSYYYNKCIKELIDLNIIYEYRYCYSKKHNVTIRLFSMEPKIYQWKYWDGSTPILPSTAIRIIRSSPEVCKKICCIIKQINKFFTLERAMIHFANYVYEKIITKMSPDISKIIKPFNEIKKEFKIYEYLNSYLMNELSKFDEFYGLKDDIESKIIEKNPELIDKILGLNKSVKLKNIKGYNAEKTLLADKNNDMSYKRENAFSSVAENAVNALGTNELQKTGPLLTDNINILRDTFIYNSSLNNNKKEYNNNMLQNNIRQPKNKKQRMCVQDIVPPHSSVGNYKKKKKTTKPSSGSKKYRKHIDGFCYSNLTGKITKSGGDFLHFFKTIIRKYHQDIVFPNNHTYYAYEINNAKYTIDDLIKIKCCNDSVVTEWMEWYSQTFLQGKKDKDQKYLSIGYMRKTWKDFDKVRRKIIPMSEQKSELRDNSILYKIKNIYNGNFNNENIIKSLSFFGIVITANYLLNKIGDASDVTNQIDDIFKIIKGKEDKESIAISIFNSTCKYLCEKTYLQETLLNDWVNRYNYIWNAVKCDYGFYKKSKILIELESEKAKDFFDNL